MPLMKCPFPGMDPWLEHPRLFPDVHNALVADLRKVLAPVLRPRYFVHLEERAYQAAPDALEVIPDLTVAHLPGESTAGSNTASAPAATTVEVPVPVEVRETYLEVRVAATQQVVTVVELLSPSNKLASGRGRERYERKREEVLGTRTHLVEVDLLRSGQPMPVRRGADPSAGDYRLLVCRGDHRPRGELFLFSVRDPIPTFRLPLLEPDDEPEVDLGQVLRELYDVVGYELVLDYAADPVPRLSSDDAAWAADLLRTAGLRE